MARILVADDDPEMRALLVEMLTDEGFDVAVAEDGVAALERIRTDAPALMLLDLGMPRLGGMEVLAQNREARVPVIVLTAHGDVALVVEAMRRGAEDYLTKPFGRDELLLRVRNVLERHALRAEIQTLRGQLGGTGLREQMGPSEAIGRLAERVRLVAASSFSVLIEGETGTGKEIVARAIHRQSRRHDQRFVAVNCGAIPEPLIEAELFGYEKGAFTGADHRRTGYFDAADSGTLFLDEITSMPASAQATLLRVLQEREIQPLGARQARQVDVRIIAASNIEMDGEVRAGRFRQDLYYRLNEFAIEVPALRERREDIVYLAQRFLDEASMELQHPARDIAAGAAERLREYGWPGNVRELRNVMRRAALLCSGPILVEHVDIAPPNVDQRAETSAPLRPGFSLRQIAETAAEHAEREAIRQALVAARGNKSEAARLLGTEYKTLHLKMRRYAIPARDGPES